ncbi:MAG: T9SS type A sorting domain-containing protein [Lentimicrobiaceae bacterium]|nr:T9SS type A sorting domain-containing protein [Lentimicrobiaceae bacterium]
MKKTIFFIIALALSTSLPAQVKVNKEKHQAVPVNMEQNKCYTGFEQHEDVVSQPGPNKIVPPTDQFYEWIGLTHFNLATNRNSRNTIGFKPKSTVGAAVWTTAINEQMSRGTGINYYNYSAAHGSFWGDVQPGDERIETERTGWGIHGFTNQGEIVVAHNALSSIGGGLVVNTRNIAGEGIWNEYTLLGPQYLITGTPTTSILWPTMATHKNTVHIVCVTEQWPASIAYPPNYEPDPDAHPHGYLGFSTLPLYYRSTDGGQTWETPRDFREYGMTNFECFRVTGDSYVLAVRENHVVFLYHDKSGFINYMESKDGGDTWVKKTVYDCGWEFAQNADVEPRLVPSTAAAFIDEDHKVHVIFSTQCWVKIAGTEYYFAGTPTGMIYWNDAHEPINWQEIRGWLDGNTLVDWNWEEYPMYLTLPSVLGFDQFYRWSLGPITNLGAFNNNGWVIFPRVMAKDGRVYLSYQAPLEWPLSAGEYFYRGIFMTVSEDNGETWDVQNNTSWISYQPELFRVNWNAYQEPVYDPYENAWYWDPSSVIVQTRTENAYPSMSYNYKGNLFMLQWFHQEAPFSQPAGLSHDPALVFAFTHDLRNIPAYKNIREIYKGLWNGYDYTIDLPPDACERPVELTGTCSGNDAVINWEAPDYISAPLLGYNIFLNGEMINESLITETHFVDEDLEFGIPYHYSVSAVYQNCESSSTYPLTIMLACETPVELSGSVYENEVVLSWKKPANNYCLLGYNIYRDGDKINESLITDTDYTDENLTPGTYLYQVSAIYEFCESELTDGVSLIVLACETPVELSGTDNENTAIISWNEPENIDGVLLGYNIYRDDVMINILPIKVREYMDEGLENGIYLYQVSAIYEHCESELTDTVSVEITVGINDFTIASFNIYPNPTTGNVTFKGAGLNRVEIFEIQGRKLAGYENVNGILQINVSQYTNGIYFIKMYSDDHQIVTKRLIILK